MYSYEIQAAKITEELQISSKNAADDHAARST